MRGGGELEHRVPSRHDVPKRGGGPRQPLSSFLFFCWHTRHSLMLSLHTHTHTLSHQLRTEILERYGEGNCVDVVDCEEVRENSGASAAPPDFGACAPLAHAVPTARCGPGARPSQVHAEPARVCVEGNGLARSGPMMMKGGREGRADGARDRPSAPRLSLKKNKPSPRPPYPHPPPSLLIVRRPHPPPHRPPRPLPGRHLRRRRAHRQRGRPVQLGAQGGRRGGPRERGRGGGGGEGGGGRRRGCRPGPHRQARPPFGRPLWRLRPGQQAVRTLLRGRQAPGHGAGDPGRGPGGAAGGRRR